MIKAILFDFDGVLTVDKTGSVSTLRHLSSYTGISYDVLKTAYYKYNKDLLYGKCTHQDIWSDFCRDIGFNVDFRILIDAFIHTALDYRMLSIVETLKQNYFTGLITDNKIDRMVTILQHHNLSPLFDVVAISAECQSGKSECHIFDVALSSLGLQAHECVFIDNSEKNLLVPAEMGFHTIYFDDKTRNIELFEQTLDHILLDS